MGSGSLNAMAVFEASYKEDMTQKEAEALVARAIRSGTALCSNRGFQHHLSDCQVSDTTQNVVQI
jgi:20S proteasome alpha/beta subunit